MVTHKPRRREFIIQDLLGKIERGELLPNTKLPTIQELIAQYTTSSITVRTALKELVLRGYLVSRQGSGFYVTDQLRSRSVLRERVIGMIAQASDHPLVSRVLAGIEKGCQEHDYNVVFAQSLGNLALEAKKLTELAALTRGLLVIPAFSNGNFAAFQNLHEQNIPLVFIDKAVNGLPIPLVATDNEDGGSQATSHLLDQGFTKVFVIAAGSPEEFSTIRERIAGCRRAFQSRSIPLDPNFLLQASVHSEIAGYMLTKRLLADRRPPERFGIFALNDQIAHGCYRALKEAELQIPGDVAVVGFDDLFSIYLDPPLTTVYQDLETMGRKAVTLLLDLIDQSASTTTFPPTFHNTRLPAELRVRNSTSQNSGFSIRQYLLDQAEKPAREAPAGSASQPPVVLPS